MSKDIPLSKIKKVVTKIKRHNQIVDILNTYAVCDRTGVPDFTSSTGISTVHYALMNAEELARKIIKEVL